MVLKRVLILSNCVVAPRTMKKGSNSFSPAKATGSWYRDVGGGFNGNFIGT